MAANVQTLHRIGRPGPLSGWSNLVRKEFGLWFRTRRGLLQALIWVGVINGLMAIMPLLLAAAPPEEIPPVMEIFPQLFVGLGNFAAALAAIIAGQDLLIGERQSGTAAWVLSKPVSRFAFLLAKFAGTLVPLWLVAVALPAAVGYLEFHLMAEGMAVSTLAVILGIQSLTLIFYLALSILLGTLFRTRGPILGATLALLLGGSSLTNFLPKAGLVLPSRLPDVGVALAMGIPVPSLYPFPILPLVVTTVSALLFLLVAVLRFGREEL